MTAENLHCPVWDLKPTKATLSNKIKETKLGMVSYDKNCNGGNTSILIRNSLYRLCVQR